MILVKSDNMDMIDRFSQYDKETLKQIAKKGKSKYAKLTARYLLGQLTLDEYMDALSEMFE